MLKYDPISHHIWVEPVQVASRPDARRVLAGLAAAGLAARFALLGSLRAATRLRG